MSLSAGYRLQHHDDISQRVPEELNFGKLILRGRDWDVGLGVKSRH
jgi:hypothetical protein